MFRIRCHGREWVPREGGALVLSNHQSHLDPVLVGVACNRRLNFLARKTLFRFAPLGWLIDSLDAIPIDREGTVLGGLWGATGYGWLSAAPAIGACLTGIALAPVVPRIERRGVVLLSSVAAYGLATCAFGLSRSFAITFACLAAVGAADTVSTVLRNLIRQLATPDELRGRMTAVNMLFFLCGPQLGELEAGAVANAFGAPFSVVTGGAACVLATCWFALRAPVLARHRREA